MPKAYRSAYVVDYPNQTRHSSYPRSRLNSSPANKFLDVCLNLFCHVLLLHAVESTVPSPCHLAMVLSRFVALLLTMAICKSFGPYELDAARGLVGNLDSAENQVTASAVSDETKRVLPSLGFRAEAAKYSSTRKRSFKRACRRAAISGKTLYRGRWMSARQLGVERRVFPDSPPQHIPVQLSGKLGQPLRAGRLKCLSFWRF